MISHKFVPTGGINNIPALKWLAADRGQAIAWTNVTVSIYVNGRNAITATASA